VPNFSEGRDVRVIEAITGEISAVPGVVLLDVDPGRATNRTVVTLAGPPDAVEDAAFRGIAAAARLIDMSRHHGEHPRMGATDVCPFVPMRGATLEDCAEMARRVGRRVGEELGIPVYLYGAAASRPERVRLPDIREGEYEALREKLEDPSFAPDYGPRRFNARSGATVVGARPFLIAWNVNLNTRNRALANRIAAALRETGGPKRGEDGKIVRDAAGAPEQQPGRFKELQGGGWYIAEYGRVQISFNLTDYTRTSLHEVFDACREEAGKLGLRVTGSELVGLVPLAAILAAGDHYLAKQGSTTGVPEADRIQSAVMSLGLTDLAPFDPMKKVLEYRYGGPAAGLAGLRLVDFVDELSRDSATPGGGSVAALCGALSAALSSMVAALTWSGKGLEERRPQMREWGESAQAAQDWFLTAADRDASAYQKVLQARRLPRKTEKDKAVRAEALARANEEAARVPLEVLERSVSALELARGVASHGLTASCSDAGVAGACALAAAEGAALNVRVNLPSIGDAAAARLLVSRQVELLARARALAAEVRETVDAVLSRAGTS
jgi:glutamate formiminotransferase/formiminotetrahydrofolate cyclodeaminase